MEEKTCCVTGHRDIPTDQVEYVKRELNREIESAIAAGYTRFISGFDGLIFALVETSLNYDIAKGELSESRPNYFVAGGVKDSEADFAFDNVGHSSISSLYHLHLSDEARARAEKTLAERTARDKGEKPSIRSFLHDAKKDRAEQPSVIEKPIPGRSDGER